ncbi:MAG: (d)CMP kinase [Arachnia propionica]|uniref:(d)CMP kinase n=1 Tax=Arachnia propionica TaxID=1750 RepID=UPI002708AE29|nr:(d)CMP kinase [Arachnia propionica]
MGDLVIAMDGPSGVGKSSTAKEVARRLNLAHLDTGAMYRAVACEVRRLGADHDDTVAITGIALSSDLRIATDPDRPRVTIAGRDVTDEIREPEISASVSAVARIPEVRRHLIARMREIIAAHNRRIVVEGRDITTVVAPEAQVRLLLTADPEARIRRRAAELAEVDHQVVTDSIMGRDREDSTVSNFTVATDGVVTIDSTDLTLDEVVEAVLDLAGAHD